jgi:exonuclease III
MDHNLQTSHILCLNEIKVKTQKKSSHQYSNHSKYKSIVTYKSQGTMLLYDRNIVLDSCECVIMSRSKFLATSFNTNTCRAIHIIAIYKPPSLSLTIFLSTLRKLISKSSTICPIVVLGDFNVDVLKKQTSKVKHSL